MEGEAGEFQDWEVLHNSESDLINSSESSEKLNELEYLEGDSEGIIRSDYFSLDYERTASRVNLSEESSVDSDNPSWVDPDSETPFERKNLAEFWSDSGSDRSFQHKISEIDAKNELGFVEKAKIEVGFEGIDEIQTHSEDSGKCWSDSGKDNGTDGSIMDSGGGIGDSKGCLEGEKHEVSKETESGYDDVAIQEVKSRGEEEKRKVVWWRIPLELLKFCVFKASPAWSFSLAAAVVGFVILGRRLYKMKRKSQGLQLKVTVDDKKVSQFMSRAARLNEAFSVVRRVPIIRPSLPAGGVTPWPVMSLR